MENPIKIGPNNAFTLSPRALKHIIEGDFTTKVERPAGGGRTITTTVISGGLHTYSALKNLLKKHPKLTSLDAFDSDTDEDWFYIRELQNEVITAKLPRKLFASKAADITLLPETYYKSGYLWKTLFPKSFNQSEILDLIDQALHNIDKENSSEPSSPEQDYHIVGYVNAKHPMTAMRIQIQLQGNEIRSAFPSWTQPWSGNNGKPFSHADTISLIMSESVERTNGEHYKSSKIWHNNEPSYENLKRLTPDFTITRTIPKKGRPHDEWRRKRLEALDVIARQLTHQDILKILAYVTDHAITKESSFQQAFLYHSNIAKSGSPLDYNACQISQNVYECFHVLLKYDLYKKTNHFINCMQRYLQTSVIHTGGIHLFELKRLHKLFIDGVSAHHNQNSVQIFLDALSASPSRAATYHEFNVNTYNKRHDEDSMTTIGINGVILPVDSRILIDFVALNLGENYLLSFSAHQREDIARSLIFSQFSKKHISDALSYFLGSDFDFFAFRLPSLITAEGKTRPSDKTLERVIRDYHRMLVMYRQRLVLDDVISYGSDPYELEWMSPEFCDLVIIQHKRKFVQIIHEHFLKSINENYESKKIQRLCKILLKSTNKEAVPLPQYIPDYIQSWMQDDAYAKTKELDLSIFKRNPSYVNPPK
ncbi:hypothetical protein [Pseudomonas syringae]|uniref:hypothetical protein n=1 Tax=Pseudomonas syringae TaxID=317 RepID=UPI0002A797A2|nr:hypothetical protein [Pseudomonas syringae]ELP97369.1 hypothetical protein A979_19240 [Pseudomonas syringae BRIP34876]ELP99239.1 hypothetical protein A987_20755 [Pseudomonas syringae BRIP34881]